MRRQIFILITALIVFSSCKLKDDTSSNIVDPGTSTVAVTVLAPNGGELLSEGSSYQIQWSGTGTPLVKIQYSVDNGTTWALVVDSLKNTGVYNWFPVPNTISNQCRIRVASVDGVTSDASDKSFAIIKNSNESLKLVSPVGKEAWEAGSAKQIKWYSSGLDSIKIEYTTNNGQRWNYIAVDKKNTGIYYWEPVPNTPSTLAKIRISDAKDGAPSVESSDVFEILPEPKLRVIAPNGGERILAGTSRKIEYVSENVENVKIAYSTNNGFNWTTITESISATGFYVWEPVPNLNSQLCKVRIYDAKDGEPSDVSDDNFAIMNAGAQQIKVTSPNGGEKWSLGSSQNITWDAGGIANVKIEYTINNGNSWVTLIASTPSNGFYTWSQIPNTLSTNCKVRISDAQDGAPVDESDLFFSIVPAPDIKVVTPNGGETVQSGTNYEIRWTSENVENVRIEYTLNGGAVWTTIINTTPSIGTYLWTNVPNTNSLQCKIRVSDAHNGTPFDISDQNFQITNLVVKSIKVISPNGGEDWEAGTQQNITWNSSGIEKVKIELSSNKGASWSVLVDNYTGGAYQWTIGETLNSSQCQIRISEAPINTISDISDGVFIISPRKFINVISPRGPVTYKDSDPVEIVWESGGIKTVGIKYTWNDGVAVYPDIPAYTVLVDKIANQGHFTTSFSIPSDKYHVVVYNADEGSNNTPSARNIGSFTIVKTEIPKITIIAPNGNEQWLVSKPKDEIHTHQDSINYYHPFEIRWNATNMEKVKIEWSTTGGGSWNPVPYADNTTNDGIFVWAPGYLEKSLGYPIPDSSDNCLIRISKPDGPTSLSDLSDNFYSLHKSKKIRVEFPNNGEDFWTPLDFSVSTINWPMGIRWTSYAVYSVNIYYSLDNGVTWEPLATNYQSTGAFAWDFVRGPVVENRISTLGRIKIEDAALENPSLPPHRRIWDVNDIPFWLHYKKSSSIVPDNNPIKVQKKR